MHSVALSSKAFGVYVILTGITLAIAPNALLAVLGLPPTTEIWIRVVGVLAAGAVRGRRRAGCDLDGPGAPEGGGFLSLVQGPAGPQAGRVRLRRTP